MHSWFEEQIEEGKLSRDGKPGSGGLESVYCGGMHTLAIDEAGRVSPCVVLNQFGACSNPILGPFMGYQ